MSSRRRASGKLEKQIPRHALTAPRLRAARNDKVLRQSRRSEHTHPAIEFLQRQLALQPMPLLAVADLAGQRWQEVKSNVGGLEFGRVGVGDVMRQRPKGCGPRRRGRLRTRC